MAEELEDNDALPFEVENERLPTWSYVASASVIAVGIAVALHLLPMLLLLPFLVASSLGRRFASSPMHVEVHDDGVSLGEREVAHAAIADVWLDPDDPRVVIAIAAGAAEKPYELVVLYFQNREQAKRFSDEVSARTTRKCVVAGHAPRLIDSLPSLRFVAIAAAFVGTGSPIGAAALLFFAIGAYPFVRAKQIVVKKSSSSGSASFDARSAFGSTRHDADAETVIARGSIRDLTLAAPPWVERSRARVLAEIK